MIANYLLLGAALFSIGAYGVLARRNLLIVLMSLELMLNGVLLIVVGCWSDSAGGDPKGQLLAIIVMAVMAVDMAIGFALVTAVYRKRQVDVIEGLTTMKH